MEKDNIRLGQDYRNLADLGSTVTDLLIAEKPELEPKKAKIIVREPVKQESPFTVLLPGIVISPDIVYRNQSKLLSSMGQNVATVEYSNQGYSQELISAQLLDFVESQGSDQKINLIGLSIGARAIIDALSSFPDEAKQKVDSIILLGLIYSDLDLKNDFFGKLTHIANRIAPDQVLSRLSGLVKKYIKTDPMFESDTNSGDLVRQQVEELSPEVIVDMFNALSRSEPIKAVKPFNGIKAGIGWWYDDHASSSARNRALNLFNSPHEFTIQGHHGWTETGAEDINAAIEKIIG
jgi:hypothetical protein